MKKTILLGAGILALTLASCSNEEIPVSQATTLKVNPASVIAPFEGIEWNSGDLEGLDSDYKVRISLFIYDTDGNLKKSEVDYVSNYSQQMVLTPSLPRGEYTAVVVTDVVERPDETVEFEYWTLAETEKLATLRINDEGYIGGKNKILGVASGHITIGEGTPEYTIYPRPTGAMFLLFWQKIHTFSDVYELKLLTNRAADRLTFNSNGQYQLEVKNNNNNYDWRVGYIDPNNYDNSTNIYGYYFVMPFTNVSYKWRISYGNNQHLDTDPMTFSVGAGESYKININLDDDGYITYGYEQISRASQSEHNLPEGTLKSLGNDCKSYKVIDLL